MKNNVSAWNFSVISVQTDGNCFFTYFSLALVQGISKRKPIFGVDVNGSISVLSSKLREVIVQEWLGVNRCEYESSFTNQEL